MKTTHEDTMREAMTALLTAVKYAGLNILPNNAGLGYVAYVPEQFVTDAEAALQPRKGGQAPVGVTEEPDQHIISEMWMAYVDAKTNRQNYNYACEESDHRGMQGILALLVKKGYARFPHLLSVEPVSEEELVAVMKAAKPERLVTKAYSEFNSGAFEERVEYLQTDYAKARALLTHYRIVRRSPAEQE